MTADLTSDLAAAAAGHDLWALPCADPDIATAPTDPTVAGLLARPETLGRRCGDRSAATSPGRWTTGCRPSARRTCAGPSPA